jgi:hypothetical protein
LKDIPGEMLVQHRDFLLSVVESKDVPAVRTRAIERLDDLGARLDSNASITQRLARLLWEEPNDSIRVTLVNHLGNLMAGHRSENDFLFDAFATALSKDSCPKVRRLAADRLGFFFEPHRSLSALQAALGLELDNDVKKAIERGIGDARAARLRPN